MPCPCLALRPDMAPCCCPTDAVIAGRGQHYWGCHNPVVFPFRGHPWSFDRALLRFSTIWDLFLLLSMVQHQTCGSSKMMCAAFFLRGISVEFGFSMDL